MRFFLGSGCVVVVLVLCGRAAADEKDWITLIGDGSEDVWQKPGTKGWLTGGGAELNPKNPRRLTTLPGKGVLVNGPLGRLPDLVTKQQFTDVEVHVEFLIPKRSNSGVKLMGKYEIQITDSHGKRKLSGDDCGGIYPRAELRPRYHHIDEGTAPRVNAAKPAGAWQTLDTVFRAPRFDEQGKKTASARFVKVTLNGQVIHENVEVKYPTGAAWVTKETATGPLLLQADHGPVAFRNVRIRPLR
jgi:hypothetical protein